MVTGVISQKIWYKVYKKDGWTGSATYYVKVDGSDYSSSEDYEEVVKYGLILRPISGFGYSLPKVIVNPHQINDIGEKAMLNADVTNNLNQSTQSLVVGMRPSWRPGSDQVKPPRLRESDQVMCPVF